MTAALRVLRVPHDAGDLPMLVDSQGLPVVGPSEWVLRNRSDAANTQDRNLRELMPLIEWEESLAIDFRTCIESGRGVTLAEVDALIERLRAARGAAASRQATVGQNSFNARVLTNRAYLQWVIESIIHCLPVRDTKFARIQVCKTDILQWLDEGICRGKTTPRRRSVLNLEAQRRLLWIVHPDNPAGYAVSKAVRQRNFVMIVLLLCAGLRIGELLCARVEDFLLGARPAIIVKKRDPDPNDPRDPKPAVKCGDRMVPLDMASARVIDCYILEGRQAQLGDRADLGYLILGDKGAPLSIYRAGEILREIRKAYPTDVPADLTPHLLRHAFTQNVRTALEQAGFADDKVTAGIALLRGDRSETSQNTYLDAETEERAQAALRRYHASQIAPLEDVPW